MSLIINNNNNLSLVLAASDFKQKGMFFYICRKLEIPKKEWKKINEISIDVECKTSIVRYY